MTNWRATARRVAFAALALPAACQQQPEHPAPLHQPTDAQAAVFAILDEIDPLDTGRLEPVRVLSRSGPGVHGWLLAQDATTVTVRTEDFEFLVLSKHTWGPSALDLTYVLPEPVTAAFEEHLATAIRPEAVLRIPSPLPIPLKLLLDCRALARRGDHDAVERAWPRLAGLLPEHLAEATATLLMREVLDPTCSWLELLDRHERWLAHFRGRWRTDWIEGQLADITEVVAKDLERRRVGKPGDLEDLVFRLHHESRPRFTEELERVLCGLGPVPRERNRPIDALLAAGLPCVPGLLAARKDHSPARCLWWDFRTSFGFATCGDLAECALRELAGFDAPREFGSWDAWYERAQQVGIGTLLEQHVARREPFAMLCFARQFPADVRTVIAAAERGTPEDENVLWKVLDELPGRVPDEIAATFLDRIARITDFGGALPGLWRLADEGHPEVVPRALERWRTLQHDARRGFAGIGLLDWLALGRATGQWREVWKVLEEPAAVGYLGREMLELLTQPTPLLHWAPLLDDPFAREPLRRAFAAVREDGTGELAQEHTFVCRGVPLVVMHATFADAAEWALAEFWPDQPPFDARRTSSVRARTRRNGGVAPARDPVSLPANLVREVVIDGDLARQSPERVRVLRALEGRLLTRPALLAALEGYLRPQKARGEPGPLVCTAERTGLGDGIVIRCAATSHWTERRLGWLATGSVDDDRWSLDVTIVVAGQRFHRSPAHLDWRDWIADGVAIARRKANPEESARVAFAPCEIDAALALPATTGFEMHCRMVAR